MDKKYLLLGIIVLGLIGFAVVLQMNMETVEDTTTTTPQATVPATPPVTNTTPSIDEPEVGNSFEGDSIVDLALSNPEFSTLVTALEAADLVEVLSTTGDYTVFAPTNAAFDALPEGTLESLLEPVNQEQLQEILFNHVVSGKVLAEDIVTLSEVETLGGSLVTIDSEESVTLNSSVNVIETDLEASNGVIHVIDTVLLPE